MKLFSIVALGTAVVMVIVAAVSALISLQEPGRMFQTSALLCVENGSTTKADEQLTRKPDRDIDYPKTGIRTANDLIALMNACKEFLSK